MAHRLFPLVAAVLLLALGQQSDGQTVIAPPPQIDSPKSNVPPPPIYEISKEKIDSLVEKAFGNDSNEMKRPIRLWIEDFGIIISAKEVKIEGGAGSVRFLSASVGFPEEKKTLRGDEAVIRPGRAISQWKELARLNIESVELHTKTCTIRILPVRATPPTADSMFSALSTVESPNDKKVVEQSLRPISPDDLKKADTVEPLPVPQRVARPVELRFSFKVDPKTPLADLLPTPPKTSTKLPLWTNEDLAKVPELAFGEPISKELSKHNAMEKTAHVMAKINHLNAKKRDGFTLAMLEQRPDLRGLPFLMGDECRTREEQTKVFAFMANAMRAMAGNEREMSLLQMSQIGLSAKAMSKFGDAKQAGIPQGSSDQWHLASVAAAMQVFMPESEQSRVNLANALASIPHIDATKALAKLAIFSPEDEVRAAAIDGLKTRREKDYTDVLLQGFRYPLAAVSKRAAEAMVKLERKDLLANLVEVLESPDPRLPVTEKRDGKDVTFVRELVKVNHHRNCLLCHAPGNTDNTPEGVLKVAVPLPSEPLAKPSEGGGYQSTPPATPDIVVRLDMTYLRQDFSVMMPVSDAHPWPEMQRFDFLVRTRTLTAAEAQAYEEFECCEVPVPGQLSPYHRSALYALRELTGRDTEPTAAAWRKLLKLARK